MTDEEKRRRKYQAIAKSLGFVSESEDIASEAMLGYLENPHWKQTPRQIVLDAIRKIYKGRNGAENREAIFRRIGGEQERKILLSVANARIEEGIDPNRIRNVIDKLERDDRAFFILRFIWGFEVTEIAYCFGLNKNTVSLRLKNLRDSFAFIKY